MPGPNAPCLRALGLSTRHFSGLRHLLVVCVFFLGRLQSSSALQEKQACVVAGHGVFARGGFLRADITSSSLRPCTLCIFLHWRFSVARSMCALPGFSLLVLDSTCVRGVHTGVSRRWKCGRVFTLVLHWLRVDDGIQQTVPALVTALDSLTG